MNLYTLHPETFLKRDVIDKFTSLVWTERYIRAGEFLLTMPASGTVISQLTEGTPVVINDSRDVMLVDTLSIEDSVLTVSGFSILKFLENRLLRLLESNLTSEPDGQGYYMTGIPGFIISEMVRLFTVDGVFMDSVFLYTGLDGPHEKFPNLTIDSYDNTGVSTQIRFQFGPLYDTIVEAAEIYGIGLSLYLHSATLSDYDLRFKTYRGLDRTSAQSVNPVVRFSRAQDSLTNEKELRSVTKFKNVAYVYSPAMATIHITRPGMAYSGGASDTTIGLARRTITEMASDITPDVCNYEAATLLDMLDQRAKQLLAKNNYINMVDGEVIQLGDFKYGIHYGLGDFVELQAASKQIQKVQVIEHTRSQDSTGERAYPTFSMTDYVATTTYIPSD